MDEVLSGQHLWWMMQAKVRSNKEMKNRACGFLTVEDLIIVK